jgi:hypothetical protein
MTGSFYAWWRVRWKRSFGPTGLGLRSRHVCGQCGGPGSSSGKTTQGRQSQSGTEGQNHCHGCAWRLRFALGHCVTANPLSPVPISYGRTGIALPRLEKLVFRSPAGANPFLLTVFHPQGAKTSWDVLNSAGRRGPEQQPALASSAR